MIPLTRTIVNSFPWVVLIHVAFFIAFWLTNASFYSYTNDYLADLLGTRIDYVSLCLLLSAALCLWTAARLLSDRSVWLQRFSSTTGWLYVILSLVYLVFLCGSFSLLLRESPVQLPRLGQMFLYFRIIIDALLLLALTLAGALWLKRQFPLEQTAGASTYAMAALPIVAALGLIWSLMLMFPPDAVYSGSLPPKPLIIAHRGASMLAPENTLASLEKAASLQTFGVEFDVCLSRDGIPFLIHDGDLNRTTNVAQVFPGREKDQTESFTLAEVKQLNAGEWFVNRDPYKAVSTRAVPAADVERYRREPVPTLAEALDILRSSRQTFIFDLKESPANHPEDSSLFHIVLEQMHPAGVDSQVWFLVDREQLAVLRAEAPEMKAAYGVDFRQPPDAGVLAAQGYRIVNAEYGLSNDRIRAYHDSKLSVNIYTVDEPWQFSRLWLLGVNSITTSSVQEMTALTAPILSLPYSLYLRLWIAFGVLALVIFGLAIRHI